MPCLEVLGEDEHAHRGPVLPAQLPGGLQPLDGVGRRHPYVDHRHVGTFGPDQRQQLLGVAGLADHLEPLEPEQLGHARPEQDGVVGEDYAHGSTAVTRVPRPVRAVHREGAAARCDPVGQPGEPGPVGPRAADAVVGHRHAPAGRRGEWR